MTFFIHDPLTGEPYSRDPRNIAQKAEDYLRSTGIARHHLLRAGGGVLHLRRIRFETSAERGLLLHRLDRGRLEHRTRRGRQATSGYKPRYKGGYFPVPPIDHFTDLRSEMVARR